MFLSTLLLVECWLHPICGSHSAQQWQCGDFWSAPLQICCIPLRCCIFFLDLLALYNSLRVSRGRNQRLWYLMISSCFSKFLSWLSLQECLDSIWGTFVIREWMMHQKPISVSNKRVGSVLALYFTPVSHEQLCPVKFEVVVLVDSSARSVCLN